MPRGVIGKPLKIENFSDGLNTRFANTEIEPTESPDLQNVIFDNKGELKKRNGYAKVTTGGVGSSAIINDQFLYKKNNSDEYHLVASATDVYQRTSPGGTSWTSIKTFAAVAIGDATTQFDITNPTGTTFRYTWDTTGTDPDVDGNVHVGKSIIINAQNFNAANNLTATVTAVAATYFEITNASGVAENNKTIGTGSITIPSTGERYSYSAVDEFVYFGNGINDWAKWDGTTLTDVSTIPRGNIAVYWNQKLWVVNSLNPSKLSHSKTNAALGDVEDFSTGDTSFLLIGKDDGQKITAIVPFGNSLLVFKDRSTYKVFYNDASTIDAYAQDLVDPIHGCVSKDAATTVQNDVFFFTGTEVRRIGFESNFFEGVRSNPTSEKIEDQFSGLTAPTNSYMTFYDQKLFLAVSKSASIVDTVYVLDTRYRGWTKWTNVTVNSWLPDTINEKLYFGHNVAATDFVFEFDTSFSDNGTAITAFWKSKRFDLDAPYLYKRFRWLYTVSRNLTGVLKYQIEVLDNQAVRKTTEASFQIGQDTPEDVWGAMEYAVSQWGGPEDDFDDPDLIYNRISLGGQGISIQFIFKNDVLDEDLSLQSITLIYSAKSLKHYPSSYTR